MCGCVTVVGTRPMLCSSCLIFMNGAVLWSFPVVNLMLPRHLPLCLVVYSCAVGAS